jgi:hypothetical protein
MNYLNKSYIFLKTLLLIARPCTKLRSHFTILRTRRVLITDCRKLWCRCLVMPPVDIQSNRISRTRSNFPEVKIMGMSTHTQNDFINSISIINGLIHLFSSLFYDWSITSTRVRSSASSCNLQYTLFSLKSSSSCLRLLPCMLITSILLSFLQ